MTNRNTIWIAVFVIPSLYYAARLAAPDVYLLLALALHWVLASLAIVWSYVQLGHPKEMGLDHLFRRFTVFVAAITACSIGFNYWFGSESLADWQWGIIPHQLGRRGYVVMAITAGFCEEVIYRGYMMTALKHAGQKPWVAMVLSSTSFVLFHGLLPWPMLVAGFIIAMVWAAIAHKTSNLWITIYFHALWDLCVCLIPWA